MSQRFNALEAYRILEESEDAVWAMEELTKDWRAGLISAKETLAKCEEYEAKNRELQARLAKLEAEHAGLVSGDRV